MFPTYLEYSKIPGALITYWALVGISLFLFLLFCTLLSHLRRRRVELLHIYLLTISGAKIRTALLLRYQRVMERSALGSEHWSGSS